MTDERMGEGVWRALEALPHGAGVVFRHHATRPAERRALFAAVRRVARRKRLLLILAGSSPLPGAAGKHGAGRRIASGIHTWPVHSRREALAAARNGADLLFVSPVFATRSHPGAPALGTLRAVAIVRGLRIPAIALGGMTMHRFKRLRGFYGWAAIDAWLPSERQKRNAVPT